MSDETSDAPPHGPAHETPDETLSETDLHAAEQALREARERLLEVPAEVVVTNHVMGLYELAAIHLSADPPDLVSASLAIDAVAALVDGLGDRLGDDAPTLRDALVNIRMAFVQVKGATGQSAPGDEPSVDDTTPGDRTPGDRAPGDQAPGDQAPGDQAPGDQAPG